jgi:hypothetical protein
MWGVEIARLPQARPSVAAAQRFEVRLEDRIEDRACSTPTCVATSSISPAIEAAPSSILRANARSPAMFAAIEAIEYECAS